MRRAQLTKAQKSALVRDGFVVLRGVVPKPLIDSAQRAVNAALGELASGGADPGAVWERAGSDPAVMDLLTRTPAWPLAESLLGPGLIAPVSGASVYLRFPQPPGTAGGPRLHLDGVPGPDSAAPPGRVNTHTLKIGFLLSDVPRPDSGNFVVCRGSHALVSAWLKKAGPEALYRGLPRFPGLEPVQIRGKAGDVVLCHYLVIHDAQVNLSPRIRYAAYFDLATKGHDERWRSAVLEPWLEWPGLAGVKAPRPA